MKVSVVRNVQLQWGEMDHNEYHSDNPLLLFVRRRSVRFVISFSLSRGS